ncbi:Putative major facilitator superfamily, MFS transporter superfamily [Septoria linicola]|uniref:Cercosporin MFS transporter CTB4 n=1 Tax=Septoria linicola TaxID=215465 RepID=A0A9Q9EE09_9PEZI|nr:putative major facilitator superfamily, MFS transporter superfamily [Septoria linicola]USW48271.1 Putative major facilitator superfamily, MFS transporter superfamily [Septoria linicola]
MNREDANVAHAEYDADPVRFRSYDANNDLETSYQSLHAAQPTHTQDRLERTETANEAEEAESVSSSSSSSIRHASTASRTVTRSSTRIENDFLRYLERHPTAIQRIQDHRLQHSLTVGSRRPATSHESNNLPSFGGNKPYPPPLPPSEEYVVEFDGHEDPRHAMNWPTKKKIYISSILIFDALAATFASAIFSPAATYVQQEFSKGREVVTLATSLFVLGYAVGPSIFAPMSELYGRRLPIIIAAFAFGIFNIGVAVAKDYQTLILCRFFAGLFASCPLAVTAAVFADMYSNQYRGLAVTAFSATVINGPLMAPFIGGFISKSYLGWRWVAYIPAFMGFAAGTLALLFQEETYGPVVLVSKASELRRLTRNWGIHAKQEEVEVDLTELAVKNVARPLRILFTEPIVLLITIYMSFLYGLLYLSLTAYGIVFSQIYGFSLGVAGLPYFGMIVGVCIGLVLVVIDVPRYNKKLAANNNIPVPEWRLPITMAGGISFTVGLFMFGWTSSASIPWIVPTVAGLFLGFGIFTVFLQCLNYIIDAYLMFAASAIAANTIMRSLCGAIFPLFATYMFNGIGINWGMTLLGILSALFIPMPFLFYFYGKRIRAKSKFAPAPDIEQDKVKDEESRVDSNNARANSTEDSKKEE